MERRWKLLAVAALSAMMTAGAALAQDQDRDQQRARDQDRTQMPDQDRMRDQIRDRDIYGYQMMTEQERNEYRDRMRTAQTRQERERLLAEHYAQMQARAKERGMSPPPGGHMGGPGGGAMGGAGMGGGAMGGGMRR